ncbi:MAG: flagellar export chaperone FliS [Bacteroidales bacterium]|nr:flagellar export chaperone FliS [Clostridium sp.]MCM1203832.1 flagellar export chaperone FliS [Bacteroidales bacterium]
MPQGNPYAKYANNKVSTATPAELTLMLYEGAIKFCNLAKKDMEAGEHGNAIANIKKAREIIVELQSTLDFKYPVAKDFDLIYTYIFNLMVEITTKQSEEALEEVLVQLRELRDIWKQVMRQAKAPVQ